MTLSHVDDSGRPRMVDVGSKTPTARMARAEGWIRMSPNALDMIERHAGPKGNVLTTAELAGMMGCKRTAELIPLCHPLGLDHATVQARSDRSLPGIRMEATVKTVGRTGVEMEALTAVAVALLTVYDMIKASGYDLEIGGIRLVEKTGGRSGEWRRGNVERD